MVGRSDTILRRLLCAALLLAAGLSAAPAEPVHGRSSELGIQFELDGGSDWCNPAVVVRLGADNRSVYQPEGVPFLKMIGRIRAVINAQCSDVSRILFVGFAGQEKVFAAEMSKLTRWRRFISLDPETEAPLCAPTAADDPECGKRVAAYATVKQLLQGPAFADVEVASVMEDRTDLHAAWTANQASGALKLSHRSEHDGRYTTNAAFADANVDGLVQVCTEAQGRVSRLPAGNHGEAIAVRSVLCQRPDRPTQLNMIIVTSENDWFYLFSLWGEDPHMAAANTMANRLTEALTRR